MLTKETIYKKQNLFRTEKHNINTVEQNKKALNAYDDRRFILEDSVDTLAWGHYELNIEKNNFLNYLKASTVF